MSNGDIWVFKDNRCEIKLKELFYQSPEITIPARCCQDCFLSCHQNESRRRPWLRAYRYINLLRLHRRRFKLILVLDKLLQAVGVAASQ
jgi:hypothetical protein